MAGTSPAMTRLSWRHERAVERDGVLADGLGRGFASTSARASLPKRARISASPAMRVRASASASALSTGKVSAVSSRMAISRQPGVSVAIIGRPQAAASSRLFGRPSRRRRARRWRLLPHLADIGDMAEPAPKAEANSRSCSGAAIPDSRGRYAGEQKLELARGGERIGLDQRDHALVGEHAPDIGRGDGGRLGQRHEMLRVDAGAGSARRLPRHAEAEHRSLVVRVLHDGAASLPLEQGSQRGATSGRVDFALAVIADEQRAEPGEAVDHGDGRQPDAGDAAEQNRLQRDVVQDVEA